MRLPRSFTVKGRKWALSFVPLIDGEPDTWGRCYPDHALIRIKTGLGGRRRLEIWLHEISHAIEHEYGLALPHGKMRDHVDYLERVLHANGLTIAKKAGRA